MNANRPILRWLTTQLASYLEVPATTINPMVPLAEIGVDSVHAISLVGDVEMRFDIDVDPTMIFDYPTLSLIAEFIGAAVAERTVRLPLRPPASFLLDPLVPLLPPKVEAWFGFNPLACARGLAARVKAASRRSAHTHNRQIAAPGKIACTWSTPPGCRRTTAE